MERPMKIARLFCLILAAATFSAAQQGATNSFNVAQFKGGTVGDKLVNAQAACLPDTRITCILFIDPVLGIDANGNPLPGESTLMPLGNIPAKRANTIWFDWRVGACAVGGLGFLLFDNSGVCGDANIFYTPASLQYEADNPATFADFQLHVGVPTDGLHGLTFFRLGDGTTSAIDTAPNHIKLIQSAALGGGNYFYGKSSNANNRVIYGQGQPANGAGNNNVYNEMSGQSAGDGAAYGTIRSLVLTSFLN